MELMKIREKRDRDEDSVTRHLSGGTNYKLYSLIAVGAIVLGVVTGYGLAVTNSKAAKTGGLLPNGQQASTSLTPAQQDTKTFKDFAEGVIQPKPTPKDGEAYSEGTHVLVRQNAVPVALTSSVVDLSQYVGKKVKVYGETQKALKEGWLMDVGKVDVEQ
jgi:hypothetical protein